MTTCRFPVASSTFRPFGRALYAVVFLSLALATALAQQPTFKTGATLVRVDVTVLDRNGEPVTALTADDFEVEEDGVAQTVEACRLVTADGRSTSDDDVSLAIRSPEHAAAEAARDDVRVFLIFWDEYHIGRFANAIRARDALSQFVSSAFGPTDLVALMNPLLPVDALEFTRDRTALAQDVRGLQGRSGVYMPTRSAAEDAMLQRGDVERLRAEVSMSALKAAAVHLGSLREGRKSIIFVSEGFPLRSDATAQLQDVIQSANNNNTAIYALDPSGVTGGVSDLLRVLSDNTGAEAIVNLNTPTRALRQIVKDSSAFYLIGYSPTRALIDDGRFHQIRVRVKRPRVDVRARRGYWAPNAADVERVERETAAAELPPEVSRALGTLGVTRPDQPLDFWVGTSQDTDGRSRVAVAWALRSAGPAARTGGAALSVIAGGGHDKRIFEAPIDEGRLSFAAAPGVLQLRFTLRDASGDVISEESRSVSIPDFSAAGLSISSPIVLRARTISEFRALANAADPVPYAGHEFVRTDRLLIRFAIYGKPEATVTAHLMSRMHSPLVKLPVAPLGGQASSYQIDLPLASVARGDFLVAIEATKSGQKAAALVPLRMISP